MKRILFFALLCIGIQTAKAQTGIGTNTPNAQAILDVEADNKGVLLPRISLTNSSTFIDGTATNNHNGMMVYNTNASTSGTGLNGTGFYHWNGGASGNWYRVGSVPATTANSTQRWNGSAWVENTLLQSNGVTNTTIEGLTIGKGGGNISNNTAFGLSALENNTTGDYSTAVGSEALRQQGVGAVGNSAFGTSSLSVLTSGYLNSAFGVESLNNLLTGNFNSGFGYQSLRELTSGNNNMAIGSRSGLGLTTGSNNTLIGSNITVAPGLDSTVILSDGSGNQRMVVAPSGNVGFNGDTDPFFPVSMRGNLSLGEAAVLFPGPTTINTTLYLFTPRITGHSETYGIKLHASGGGSFGTAIFSPGRSNPAEVNRPILFLGVPQLPEGTFGDLDYIEYMRIESGTGNVGINTPTPQRLLHVNGDILAADVEASTFTTTSDRKLKKKILALNQSLEKVLQLNGVSFFWKDISRGDRSQIGFIAQEVELVLPELVYDQKDYKTVNYVGVVPLLVEATKSLNTKIENLQAENIALKASIEEVMKRLKTLEQK